MLWISVGNLRRRKLLESSRTTLSWSPLLEDQWGGHTSALAEAKVDGGALAVQLCGRATNLHDVVQRQILELTAESCGVWEVRGSLLMKQRGPNLLSSKRNSGKSRCGIPSNLHGGIRELFGSSLLDLDGMVVRKRNRAERQHI